MRRFRGVTLLLSGSFRSGASIGCLTLGVSGGDCSFGNFAALWERWERRKKNMLLTKIEGRSRVRSKVKK
jgi:hypothetical protein